MKERSNTSKQTPDSGDMMWPLFCNQVPIEEKLFLPVSPAETKKTSSQTKSENCGNTTATTKTTDGSAFARAFAFSSGGNTTATTKTTDGSLTLRQSEKTSEGGSTSSPKDCTPYWTPDCLELSQKLLSLTATPHAGGDLNMSITWPSNTTLDAWFSTHLHFAPKFPSYNTLLESLTSFPPAFSDTDATLVRTKKLRIHPQKQTARHWNRYTGLARFWFNQALEYLKQPNTKAILKEVRHIQKRPYAAWAFDCPQRIREHAIADAVKAVKNAKSKCHQTGTFQEVSWRAKKDPTQGFGLDAQSLQQTSMFSQLSHRLYFHACEGIPNESLEGVRIVRENGRWFAIVPQPRQVVKPETQRQPIVALDPGVMTWAHYRFKQHLKAKAEEYSAVVVDVNEAYTSKTCSYCGSIQNIGSKQRFRCRCGVDVDRDHQGARGIFLRALSVTTASPEALCLTSVQHLFTKR